MLNRAKKNFLEKGSNFDYLSIEPNFGSLETKDYPMAIPKSKPPKGQRKSKTVAAEDRVIERIYQQHCAGMEIDVLRIPVLFTIARTLLRAGASHDQIGSAMVSFVKASNAKE